MKKELVSEWWEVFISVPGGDTVRNERYGGAPDFRVPREGFSSKEEALKIASHNRFSKVVHVRRYKKCT